MTQVLLHACDIDKFAFPFVIHTIFMKPWFYTGNAESSIQLGDLWTLCCILDKMWSCSQMCIFL